MKYRTDFVTNSSSSSFLFRKSATLSQVKKEVFREMKKQGLEGNDDGSQYWVYHLKDIENILHKAEELSVKEFKEIFSWYAEDVLRQVFCIPEEVDDFWGYVESHDVSQKEFDAKQLQTIFTYLALSIVRQEEWFDLNKKISRNSAENMILDFTSREIILSEWLYAIFVNNYEMGMEFFQSLNKSPVELLQDLLDFNYVYYSRLASDYNFAEVLLSTPSCVHGCNHMG